MSAKSRMLLTVLINFSLVVILAGSLYFIEGEWQHQREREAKDEVKQLYFSKMENYLKEVTAFISFISVGYTNDCPRSFVLQMRKELFNIPGAIEFGVIQKEDDHGVVVCNSWGENERVLVRKPSPHDGFLMTGPHTINSLEMPIFVIKKTIESFEYNILIKKSSVDDFLNNSLDVVMSLNNKQQGSTYRDSNVVDNLSYVVPLSNSAKRYNLYFIPTTLLLFLVCFFLVTPTLVRAIEKRFLRWKIRGHVYYNEYQPIIDTNDQSLFSIEVFLRSNDGVNVKDSIDKIKSLDLCIEYTLFQVKLIKSSFSKEFISNNSFQVNISCLHLESEFFVKNMLTLGDDICSSLILEVTENENLMIQKTVIKTHMERLKQKGYRFAIDDFGIEYSSLSYISEFDFDIVKTDKIFINETDKNIAILKSIITLTNELGIACIAEGIETEKDCQKITQLGISLHQGWFHSRPMKAEDIIAYY
ncbi:EAL domain, c-di-GMP-specific phosphodiesterase class I (or its enzymatically inactive variant) [Marinomonas polaris DSM 16579]|uniref:EAL domain, c-di-GMP-specific phosphodiesterase class I (Or its enzymatically inactive variant) n=1 Tax=Marinomonas polaris DSM 16579 TaxID=1122206 RepID=A0A1M4WEV6_9GAMM|nr:EAL domain-containing protein [Marinomonas polaris]SHE79754.1 EAL domain, c-di-GMP-specific phosphodiesterase class I (or its enzymatically inactive variant) [Marinomonas polaris DSM 16579]